MWIVCVVPFSSFFFLLFRSVVCLPSTSCRFDSMFSRCVAARDEDGMKIAALHIGQASKKQQQENLEFKTCLLSFFRMKKWSKCNPFNAISYHKFRIRVSYHHHIYPHLSLSISSSRHHHQHHCLLAESEMLLKYFIILFVHALFSRFFFALECTTRFHSQSKNVCKHTQKKTTREKRKRKTTMRIWEYLKRIKVGGDLCLDANVRFGDNISVILMEGRMVGGKSEANREAILCESRFIVRFFFFAAVWPLALSLVAYLPFVAHLSLSHSTAGHGLFVSLSMKHDDANIVW